MKSFDYGHMFLRILVDTYSPSAGNSNTINPGVHSYSSFKDTKQFSQTETSNYKAILTKGGSQFSINSGMSEDIYNSHMLTFDTAHKKGVLYCLEVDEEVKRDDL